MENKNEGFDRANGQGQNHDTDGNVANADREDTGEDTEVNQDEQANVQDKPDAERVTTVTPANDNDGPPKAGADDSSNKGQGPSGENL